MPPKLPVEKEYHRRLLYQKNASDHEIAREVGVTRQVISRWRQEKHLPRHTRATTTAPTKVFCKGTPMEKALSPQQCLVMKQFLHDLLQTHKIAKRKGLKAPNITAFTNAWRQIYENQIDEMLANESIYGYGDACGPLIPLDATPSNEPGCSTPHQP